MNKHTLRTFSFGILFAVCTSAVYSYSFAKDNQQKLNINEAKEILHKAGYVLLTKNEYKKISAKASEPKSEAVKEAPGSHDSAENNNPTGVINYRLTIEKGMSSSQISTLLAAAKIIDDNKAFNDYLISHNYQTKIQLGTFDLTNKMSYEQIAKMITKT